MIWWLEKTEIKVRSIYWTILIQYTLQHVVYLRELELLIGDVGEAVEARYSSKNTSSQLSSSTPNSLCNFFILSTLTSCLNQKSKNNQRRDELFVVSCEIHQFSLQLRRFFFQSRHSILQSLVFSSLHLKSTLIRIIITAYHCKIEVAAACCTCDHTPFSVVVICLQSFVELATSCWTKISR